MITLTQNHANRACTVIKTVLWYGQEQTVALTYLNPEQVWPVRSTALAFVDDLLYRNYNK